MFLLFSVHVFLAFLHPLIALHALLVLYHVCCKNQEVSDNPIGGRWYAAQPVLGTVSASSHANFKLDQLSITPQA